MKDRIGVEPRGLLITRKITLIISSGIMKLFGSEEQAWLER